MLHRASFIRLLILMLCVVFSATACEKTPPKPGEAEFRAASKNLSSYESKVGFGNNADAVALADKFAKKAKAIDKDTFEGGDSKLDDAATKGNFLTYAQITDKAVVLLVRVPALKNYEGDDRVSLMKDVLWAAAQEVAADVVKEKELVIAARGALLYGGVAKGKLSGEPKVETGAVVSDKQLFPYFTAGAAAAKGDSKKADAKGADAKKAGDAKDAKKAEPAKAEEKK